MHLLFQHGWGFTGECWQGWLPLLQGPYTLGNRGYWGTPCRLERQSLPPGFVLVSHSLGLHFLPREFLVKAGLLVVISGFAHFHGLTPAACRISHKHVQRMLARMQSEPVELIRDFYRDCSCENLPVPKEGMDQALLTNDLTLLNQSRIDRKHTAGLPPTLLLHGREDRVVRLERAHELADILETSRLTVIDGADHGLPFTHPLLCLDIIRAFYEKVC